MLTDNQRRYIQSMLRHVEQEVLEGIAALEGEDPLALFPRYTDYPEAQRIALLRTHLERLRSAMRRFMDAQGMAPAGSDPIDAAWGFQTRMNMARNAVHELRPRYVRGYGELDAQGEEDCRSLAAELAVLLEDIARELRREPLRLPANQPTDALLALLVEVIERHGLLELRRSAERLLQGPVQGERIEVAMLGRVSSGKSSLINALLEQPLLPVGAIPVTAVVPRIIYGSTLRARATDTEGRAEEVDPQALSDYISESGNPDNRRHLREMVVEAPATILHQGVGLTDTPGLGSLHTRASAHALTYLPQCDLGILTIDASATLARQDVDLLLALKQAHASWLVAMTKCDSVSPEALAQQRHYIEHTLSDALGEAITVAGVSVTPAYADPLRHWQETSLSEALATCATRSRERRRQRLFDLARRVCVSLEQALRESPAPAEGSPHSPGKRLAALDETESRLRGLCSDLGQLGADAVLRDVLSSLVEGRNDAASYVSTEAARLADEVVRDIVADLTHVADGLDSSWLEATLRGAPPFAAPSLPSWDTAAVRGPAVWRRAVLRRRLQQHAHAAVRSAFQDYAQALQAWLNRTSRSLREALGSGDIALSGPRSEHATVCRDLAAIQALLPSGT